METLQQSLSEKARETYRNVYPCGFDRRLQDCFTTMGDKYVFWFNTDDRSTHIVVAKLPQPALA